MKPKKKQGKKRKIFISVMLIFRLLFGGTQAASASSNSKKVQDEVGSKAWRSWTLWRESFMIANLSQDDCPQSELVPEGAQRIIRTPPGYIISSIPRGGENDLPGKPSKFGSGSKAKDAAKRDFGRRQAAGGFFADAFLVRPRYPGRPGGLEPFGRVPPKLGPNPGNPVDGDGTRSSKRSQSEYQPDGYSEEQIQMYKKKEKYSELAKDPQ
ncbi:MAG: hypothetical protein SWZ49_13245 [Cyanobacteriota bacterium]|nr:hypothetical protein [Cyanobacteriota bacterium]